MAVNRTAALLPSTRVSGVINAHSRAGPASLVDRSGSHPTHVVPCYRRRKSRYHAIRLRRVLFRWRRVGLSQSATRSTSSCRGALAMRSPIDGSSYSAATCSRNRSSTLLRSPAATSSDTAAVTGKRPPPENVTGFPSSVHAWPASAASHKNPVTASTDSQTATSYPSAVITRVGFVGFDATGRGYQRCGVLSQAERRPSFQSFRRTSPQRSRARCRRGRFRPPPS